MRRKVEWKKVGGGTFRLAGGKIIKPNQKFKASVEEIPEAFRDVVVPVSGIPKPREKISAPDATYKKVETEDGFFNVVEEVSGKPMNEYLLTSEDADQVLEALI